MLLDLIICQKVTTCLCAGIGCGGLQLTNGEAGSGGTAPTSAPLRLGTPGSEAASPGPGLTWTAVMDSGLSPPDVLTEENHLCSVKLWKLQIVWMPNILKS